MGKYKTYMAGYLFLLPWIIGFIFLYLSPIIASLYLSFTNYDLLSTPKWVGFANYKTMFTEDFRMSDSIKVTFQYVFLSVPTRLAFALGLAVLLNQGMRYLNFYRTIYYIPSLLGGSVAISVLWKQVFDKEGILEYPFPGFTVYSLPTGGATS
ncbi:ABC-type sugar transport system permease subunit [Paenibacillus sp. DS2015]|uniref:carbohydrate ABC transporter permease n=1 Tax=Paenibacillus sp. DS2015 TaxID=3373917 RepID=UPI003D1C34DC